MTIDPTEILRASQNDRKFGHIAQQALEFLQGVDYSVSETLGLGQSSFSVARAYEVRKSLKNFDRAAFVGLEESIASLRSRDLIVRSFLLETAKGVIAIWVADEPPSPVGLMILKFVKSNNS